MFLRFGMMRHIWLFLAIVDALVCLTAFIVGMVFFFVFKTWGMDVFEVAQWSAITSGAFIALVVFNFRFTLFDSIMIGAGSAMFFIGLCLSLLSSPLWLLASAAGALVIFLSLGFANERSEKAQSVAAKAA